MKARMILAAALLAGCNNSPLFTASLTNSTGNDFDLADLCVTELDLYELCSSQSLAAGQRLELTHKLEFAKDGDRACVLGVGSNNEPGYYFYETCFFIDGDTVIDIDLTPDDFIPWP